MYSFFFKCVILRFWPSLRVQRGLLWRNDWSVLRGGGGGVGGIPNGCEAQIKALRQVQNEAKRSR